MIEEIFKGFSTTLPRGILMMAVYFSVLDSFRRHTTLFETQSGLFIASGVSSIFSFGTTWPLEVLKNLAQAETKGVGNTN